MTDNKNDTTIKIGADISAFEKKIQKLKKQGDELSKAIYSPKFILGNETKGSRNPFNFFRKKPSADEGKSNVVNKLLRGILKESEKLNRKLASLKEKGGATENKNTATNKILKDILKENQKLNTKIGTLKDKTGKSQNKNTATNKILKDLLKENKQINRKISKISKPRRKPAGDSGAGLAGGSGSGSGSDLGGKAKKTVTSVILDAIFKGKLGRATLRSMGAVSGAFLPIAGAVKKFTDKVPLYSELVAGNINPIIFEKLDKNLKNFGGQKEQDALNFFSKAKGLRSSSRLGNIPNEVNEAFFLHGKNRGRGIFKKFLQDMGAATSSEDFIKIAFGLKKAGKSEKDTRSLIQKIFNSPAFTRLITETTKADFDKTKIDKKASFSNKDVQKSLDDLNRANNAIKNKLSDTSTKMVVNAYKASQKPLDETMSDAVVNTIYNINKSISETPKSLSNAANHLQEIASSASKVFKNLPSLIMEGFTKNKKEQEAEIAKNYIKTPFTKEEIKRNKLSNLASFTKERIKEEQSRLESQKLMKQVMGEEISVPKGAQVNKNINAIEMSIKTLNNTLNTLNANIQEMTMMNRSILGTQAVGQNNKNATIGNINIAPGMLSNPIKY